MKYHSGFRVGIWVLAAAAPLVTAACGSAGAEPTNGQPQRDDSVEQPAPVENDPPAVKDVLLVHGAWADGSSWSGVIEILQSRGFVTVAVQLPEKTLSE